MTTPADRSAMDAAVRQFLVAVNADGTGRASLTLDDKITEQGKRDIAEFCREYAGRKLIVCDGERMKELML